MKSYTGLLALAAIAALPACSNQNGYGSRYQGGNYQESQYPSQGSYYGNASQQNQEGRYGDHHKERKEAKINAMVDDFFARADANKDGRISWKEFESYMHKKFRDADKNHDGALTRDEVKVMLNKHMHEIEKKMHSEKQPSMRNDERNDENDDNGQRSENTYRSDQMSYDNVAENRENQQE